MSRVNKLVLSLFLAAFYIIVLASVLALLSPCAFALSDAAASVSAQIEAAEGKMHDMLLQGLSVIRYNDTLLLARESYSNQLLLEEKNQSPNYQETLARLKELNTIVANAYKASDEMKVLIDAVEKSTAMNKSTIYAKLALAQESFRAERYEEALLRIEDTKNQISEMESLETKLKVWSLATSRTVATVLKENARFLITFFGTIILAGIIFYAPIRRFLIKRQLVNLEIREKSVRNLIADAQKNYFDKQTLNESTYHIKVKKYGELLRDIHRQIPLLREKYAMVKGILFFRKGKVI